MSPLRLLSALLLLAASVSLSSARASLTLDEGSSRSAVSPVLATRDRDGGGGGGSINRAIRNAYVTMMYCGTPRDYEFHIAARVMFATLAATKPNADLVVLVSRACPAAWHEEYARDGLRVIAVDDMANPYKDQPKVNRRFIHTLNKLYAWRLEEYRRVVMLDSDNVFLRNADELFQCGDFCAVFVNPCVFHTGLFVLTPSNHTYNEMLGELALGMRSADGADQGFLGSHFPDLIDRPFFRPPADGSVLKGLYRLPFGYQMDASYFYFRLKWNVPCGPNSVITFPSVPLLKPWFWWSWPVLPLGLGWHERRRTTIGYEREWPVVSAQCLAYVLVLLLALALRRRFSAADRAALTKSLLAQCPCLSDSWRVPICHPWAVKLALMVAIVGSFALPFALVPTIVHPVVGWGLFFLGSMAAQAVLLAVFYLPPLPVLTPWAALLLNALLMAAPIYGHGVQRMFTTAASAFVSAPFLWWALRGVCAAVDQVVEREPLMSRILVRSR